MATLIASSSSNVVHFLPSSSDPPYELVQAHPCLTLLSQCKDIKTFRQVHSQFIKFGLHNTQFAASKLMEFCAVNPNGGDLSYAASIFDSVRNPNHVAHNMMIRGYSLSTSSPHLALSYYARMLFLGLEPNSYTFPFLLKSCTKLAEPRVGKQIHGHALKFGLNDDVYVHTSLINMYARSGNLDDARTVFDKNGYTDAVSFTALITGYVSKGLVDRARNLFDNIPTRDVVSWNAMISGYAQIGQYDEALSLFREMREAKVDPDVSTLLTVLSCCAHQGEVEIGNQVHLWIDQRGLGLNLRLANGLIDMYAKCGDLTMARSLFEALQDKDTVSWNVMIGGYTHASEFRDALQIFRLMQMSNVDPNDVTFLNAIPACAHLGALELGKWIHAYIGKNYHKFPNETLWTSLITMYAKSGDIEAAKQTFYGLETKTLASWNAIISGLAMHGEAEKAIELFSEMSEFGFRPDEISFIGVLSACSHSGSLDLGRKIFDSMIRDYDILPQLQHYGCMIDLLGRLGFLDEAMATIETMQMDPDAAIWGSILGSCRIHRNLKLGEYAAEKLFGLEPDNPGPYILLSNIYACSGKWDDAAGIRTFLNDNGMKKIPGSTSIEVDGAVHEFLVSDRTHPKSEAIYEMLDEIDRVLEANGHVPDTSEVYYDVDEDLKEGVLCQHSEKLAIAFGLISTKAGTTLRIVKNLRVCGNCHEVTKLISKVFNREIIARDRNRFHRFKDGYCSCRDFW